jgi:NitT/TauT family transport system substrate-binding protein
MSRYSRRRVLGAAAALCAGVAMPRLVYAQAKKPVKFTLAWLAEGSNLFAFVARGMGFWDRLGLDVDIARGFGSLAAAQAIGAGRFDFGMGAPLGAILQTVKGVPLVALASCAYDATMGIGVLNEGPIKHPKDLEGRTMASTATSGEYPLLPAFAEKAGFDLSKVKRIQVDNKVRDRLLAEGKVDAISGFASSAMPNYTATGTKAHFLLYSDYGIANTSNAVLTQPARAENEPQLCAALVEGLLQGLKATMLDPDEAMKVFFKQVPEMALAAQARTQIKVGTGIMIYVSVRDTATSKGLGWIDPKNFAAETDLVMKYLAAPGDKRPDLDRMITNRFTGGVKLSAAEWRQVQKSAQGFRAYVT